MRGIPRGCLVVSCQAREDNPLHGPHFMAAMALAAAQAGAGGIRCQGAADLAAIRAAVDLPVIGLRKRWDSEFEAYITPDLDAALEIADADIIAVDATAHTRKGGAVADLIPAIRAATGKAVMADIATLAEGLAAEAAGAAYIGTTMAGYTAATKGQTGPDLALVEALVRACRVPVIAEGRYDTPELAARALALGAHAVVVGTAITNPREIARRFVTALA